MSLRTLYNEKEMSVITKMMKNIKKIKLKQHYLLNSYRDIEMVLRIVGTPEAMLRSESCS